MLKFIKEAMRRAERRRRASDELRMLEAMDERMLRDIGVTRADVDEDRRRLRRMA
jgi:uncharacterized protein YjiS (DUF1127 family)